MINGMADIDKEFFPREEAAILMAKYPNPYGPMADHISAAENRQKLLQQTR